MVSLVSSKDKVFEYFVQHGTFDGAGNPKATDFKRKNQDLIIALCCLVLIGVPTVYLFIQYLLFASLFWHIIFLLIVIAGK